MKKIIITIALVLPAIAAFPQTKNILMPSDLIMNYTIPINPNFDETFFTSNLTEVTSKKNLYCDIQQNENLTFGMIVIDGIKNNKTQLYHFSGELPGYDSLYLKYTPEEAIESIGQRTDTFEVRDKKNRLINKVVKTEPKESNFGQCSFTERWSFDAENFSMRKEVLQYSPIVRSFIIDPVTDTEEFKGWRYTGTIVSNGKTKQDQRFLTVEYEFPIGNRDLLQASIINPSVESELCPYFYTESTNSPYWTSYSRLALINMITNPVIEGTMKAYDFISDREISVEEARKNLGQRKDTVRVVSPDNGQWMDYVVTSDIKKENIRSIIFIEYWYLDPQTLAMSKVVKGIAPVYWNVEETEGKIIWKKNVAYLVKLN
ncbi:MAG: hypothetical protein V2A54_08070 [Bacteroidota bacterium]